MGLWPEWRRFELDVVPSVTWSKGPELLVPYPLSDVKASVLGFASSALHTDVSSKAAHRLCVIFAKHTC